MPIPSWMLSAFSRVSDLLAPLVFMVELPIKTHSDVLAHFHPVDSSCPYVPQGMTGTLKILPGRQVAEPKSSRSDRPFF